MAKIVKLPEKTVRERREARRKLADESQLKKADAERFHLDEPGGSYDMLAITCPQPSCRQTFWVKPGPYLAGHRGSDGMLFMTSSCPYCYKVHVRGQG